MTEPRKTDPAVKKALVYVLFLDLIAIGAFLALWFGTHNPIYSAIPIAIAGPLVAIILVRAASAGKKAVLDEANGPRIVE